MPALSESVCKYCDRPIYWGRVQNGRYRTFEREMLPASEVADGCRYAVRRHTSVVVEISGLSYPVDMPVLVEHICAAYRKAWLDARLSVDGLADLFPLVDPTRSET